jgi:hypothetical protein
MTATATAPRPQARMQAAPKAAKTTIAVEKQEEKSPYGPKFIAMMEQNMKDMKAGKYRTVTLEELDEAWK